ncbi:MAG: hypothetical protein KC417_10490 [Myxococcales bacterium]|nr:hypothetical protein [Myxococcales bacterium]
MASPSNKVDPFSFAASRSRRTLSQVFQQSLGPLGPTGEIDMAIALALKKCGQSELPSHVPTLRAFLFGPFLTTLKGLFQPEACRPAVEHLYEEIKRWAREEPEDESAIHRVDGAGAGSPETNATPTARHGGGGAGAKDVHSATTRRHRDRTASTVTEELAGSHRDFGAELRKRQAQAAPARGTDGEPTTARHASVPELPSTGRFPGVPANPLVDSAFATAPPPGPSGSIAVTAPPAPGAADLDDSEFDSLNTRLPLRRRTVPTPIHELPPVLLLTSEHGLALRIRGSLREQADVSVFTDPSQLLGAYDDLHLRSPIVILDARDDEGMLHAQEVVAFAAEDMRLIMWGWSDEESLEAGDPTRRMRCDRSVEPEDMGALVHALLAAR